MGGDDDHPDNPKRQNTQGYEDLYKIEDFSERITTLEEENNTDVFWDVEDYPFPVGSSPDEIYEKIQSALPERGPMISIWAYVDEKNESWAQLVGTKTWKSRIYFIAVRGDKRARLNRMFHDIAFWSMDVHAVFPTPSFVFVISDNVRSHKPFIGHLGSMSMGEYYYVVYLVTDVDVPRVHPEWPSVLLDQSHHPISKPFPENYREDLARIREAGTIKWPAVAEDHFKKEIARISKRRSFSEGELDDMLPISSRIPSLVGRLRAEKREEEEASRRRQLQQSETAKKKQQQVEAAKKNEQQVLAAKEQQREAAKQKQQREAAKKQEQLAQNVVGQTGVSKKRSAEEADAAALEAATAKKARMAEAASLSHAKDGVPRLCADWCKGVSNSVDLLPEFSQMDEEEVYEEYAQSSIQAMTAMNELFGRLKRGLSSSKTAQSQETAMKEAVLNGKNAHRNEQARAKYFEEELGKMRADRDGVVAELEKVNAGYKNLNIQFAHNELALNTEIENLLDELDRLRKSEQGLGCELEKLKVEYSKAYLDEQQRLRQY